MNLYGDPSGQTPTAFLGAQARAIRNGVSLWFSQPISVTMTSSHIIPTSPKQAKRFWNLTSDDRPKKLSHLRPTIHSNQETRGGWKKGTWRHRAAHRSHPGRGQGPLREGGARGGACRDLPCRRAPFLLKKVLPGQRGGPDVLKRKRKRREHELSALTRGTAHKHVLPSGFKTPSQLCTIYTLPKRIFEER